MPKTKRPKITHVKPQIILFSAMSQKRIAPTTNIWVPKNIPGLMLQGGWLNSYKMTTPRSVSILRSWLNSILNEVLNALLALLAFLVLKLQNSDQR